MNNHFISIIMPCYNEERRLSESVRQVIAHCEKYIGSRHYEVVLVENGSTDGTLLLVNELQRHYRPVRAFTVEGQSKAAAVRQGMLNAVGDYRYMCDVDLSTPISELRRFCQMMKRDWDVVIGSREHPDSEVDASFKRWAVGRTFSLITKAVIPELDYRDTQCGFKMFTARAATEIFERVQCTSLAFDVEVLYLAIQLGFYCTEMPIVWQNDADSRVRLLQDSFSMLRDVLRVKQMHAGVQPAYKKKVPA